MSRCARNLLGNAARMAALGAALFAALGLGGCGSGRKAEAPKAAPSVTVMKVAARDVPVSGEYVAQTQSSRQVEIYARVSGFLDRRLYTEGAIVKAGQILFQIDPKPFQVQVDQAAAALSKQEAALEVARSNLERTKPLAAANALSQKDLDDATGQFQSAAASVDQAKAQLESAKLNLSYCVISSPVNGAASAAVQQEGTYISPQNSQLATVMVLSPMWVNFSLSENEMQQLRDQIARGLYRPPKNSSYVAEIVLVDGTVFPHKGRITFADPSYNAQTGTFLIRVTVENPDGILRPNQYVRVRIKGAVRPKAVLVPQRAVQQGAKGQFVWIVNADGTVSPRPVVVGQWQGDDWFIDQGLQAGETVVVDGGLTLQAGVKVAAQPAK